MIIVREATLFFSKVITISHMASLYFLVDMGKPSISDLISRSCSSILSLTTFLIVALAVAAAAAASITMAWDAILDPLEQTPLALTSLVSPCIAGRGRGHDISASRGKGLAWAVSPGLDDSTFSLFLYLLARWVVFLVLVAWRLNGFGALRRGHCKLSKKRACWLE